MAGPCPKFGGEMHLKFQHPPDSCQTLPETEPDEKGNVRPGRSSLMFTAALLR